MLPSKRKLQYVISSIDKQKVLKEIFKQNKVVQQKNVFLLVDEVHVRPTVAFSSGVLSGMALNKPDCKATSMLCVMMRSLQ